MMKLKAATVIALAIILAAIAVGPSVWAAQDIVPPVIKHTAVQKAYSDANLIFSVSVTDDVALDRVTLYFRTKGTTSYYAMNMNVVLGEYRGAIPATYMQPGVIQYYIQAVDMAGNTATWPAVAATKNPQNITIEKDTTKPEARLVLPNGAVPNQSFVAVIALTDKANNIDPGTAIVMVNGEDFTAQAQVAANRVTVTVPAEMVKTHSVLQVEISDMAGNRVVRRFGVWESVIWTRELRMDMAPSEKPEIVLDTALSWGPFELAANVRNDDPTFTKEPGQPTSKYKFKYDARLLDLAVGDISSEQSPLAMSSLSHRGGDLTLRLGPLSLQGVYGFPSVSVAGEDYERKVIGIKPAFDTRFLDFSLDIVKVADNWSEAADVAAVDPKMNYVVDLQTGVGMFGDKVSLQLETAASIYFPNARGSFDLWGYLGQKANAVPQVVKDFVEVPDVLNGYQADLGAQVTFKMPLPWSQFILRGFHFGPDYKTLSGAGDFDVDGMQAKLTTSRWFNFLQMSAAYEQRNDKASSIVTCAVNAYSSDDMTAANILNCLSGGQSGRKETNSYSAAISLGKPGSLNLDFTGSLRDVGPSGALVPDTQAQGYSAALKNLRINLFGMQLRLGGTYSTMDEARTSDPSANKSTVTYVANTGLDMGSLSWDLSYGKKEERDAAGALELSSPSLDGSVTWTLRRPGVWVLRLNEVRLKAAVGQSWSVDAAGVKSDQRTTLKGEIDTRITAGLRIGGAWKSVKVGAGQTDTDLTAMLRWQF